MQSPPGASPPPATPQPDTQPDTQQTATPQPDTPATDPPATDPPATDPPATPGVVVTPTSLSVSEGDAGSYTVVLESPPTDTVTVGIEGMSGTVRVSPSSLSFSTQNWNQARTVTVTAKVDTDTVHDTVTLTHTATGGGYGSVSIESVTVTVQDVYPGLTAQFTDLPTVHDRGPSFTFGLEFNREVDTSPTSIRDDVLDVTGGTVTAATRVDSGSNRRWRITVVPDSGDDLVIVLPATRACTDAGAICTPDGLALSMPLEQTVACGLLRVTVTPASLEVVDGGGAYWVGRYSVALDRKPDSSMTITVSGTDGTGLSVSPSRLTFTRSKWSQQWVALTTHAADDDAMDETVTLTHSATGGGRCSVGIPDVIVTVRETSGLDHPVGAIRLVDGNVESEGRVEIYHVNVNEVGPGEWGTVCDDYWSLEDAHTACRQLGYSGATAAHDQAHFGEGTGRIWLDDLICSGNEERLVDCPQSYKQSFVGVHNCTHEEDAGVTCAAMTMSQRSALGAGVSVADATVQEAVGAVLDFRVSLPSPAAGESVTVDYATADGTAKAGEDYTAAAGTITFASGERHNTIRVAVLDDAKDEGSETFTLRLSNASGAQIEDGEATGTITNHDEMLDAWLARFGRTVAGQALEAIGPRMRGESGSRVVVGSFALDGEGKAVESEPPAPDRVDLDALEWNAPAGTPLAMTGRKLVLESSFRLGAGGANGAPAWAAWGRVAAGGFEAEQDDVEMDGDVTTGFLGVDASRDRWLAGVALSLSEGEGAFELVSGGETHDTGALESRLTSLYPYLRYGVTERVDVWGLLGYGTGELTLTERADGDRPVDVVTETDLEMRLGAIGVRGELLSRAEAGGFGLAVRSDAFRVRVKSDAVPAPKRMMEAEGDASRVRLVLEGSRAFELAAGGTLTPLAEVGVRHDGGDAETGTGVELGAGVRYADEARGLTIRGAVRALAAHAEGDYEEWGASGSIRMDPGASGRGLSLTVAPSWGAAWSAVQRLWSLRGAAGRSRDDDFDARHRLDAELGYGIGLSGTRGVVTPYAGLSLADGGERADYRVGTRWRVSHNAAMSLEGSRSEGGAGALDPAPEQNLALRAALRW